MNMGYPLPKRVAHQLIGWADDSSMAGQKQHVFRSLQWRLECLIYSLIEWLAGWVPGSWVFRFGEWLGGLTWYLMPARRRVVERNLRIVYAGEKSISEIRLMAKATMRRAGGNLISAAHTASLSPAKLGKVLRLEHLELLEKPIKEGRGVILLLAHMGNWELLSRLVHLFPPGTKTGAFYRPLNNEFFNERVLARRQADGTRMFSKRDPFHQVTGFLRDGGIVGVLADQRVGNQGDWVQFFGRRSLSSPLPWLLARRAKCEILALSLITEEPGKWKAVLMPVEAPPTTQHCMSALETAMRASPIDVFWLQDRWRIAIKPRHEIIDDLLGKAEHPCGKPRRILVWLLGSAAEWELPSSWIHSDATYEVALEPGREQPSWLPASTRCHVVPADLNGAGLGKFIAAVDQAADLPLDLVIAPRVLKLLEKACRSQAVDVKFLS